MLLITCPACGIATDETEFVHGGDAHAERPASTGSAHADAVALDAYLHPSGHACGWTRELWWCRAGCQTWFAALRHAGTGALAATYGLDEPMPEPPAAEAS